MDTNAWLDLLGWDNDDLRDLRFVGYSYIKQGHFETALKFFEALVILAPESAYDIQTLGAIYLEMGNNMEALKAIDKALMLDPDHEDTLLNRAKALFVLGYNAQGITLAKHLLKKDTQHIRDNADALLLAYS
jgi:cytochrome c-type biogenesis protein CcmH/NrfG